MSRLINYVGPRVIRFFKWVAMVSGTVGGVYGLVGQYYPDLPFYAQIGTFGALLAGAAMIVVGKPVKKKEGAE